VRSAKDAVLVISKKDEKENREYIVAFNNSTTASKVTINSATTAGGWKVLLGTASPTFKADKVSFTVPALSTVVIKANKTIDKTGVKVGKITSVMDDLTGYFVTNAAITSSDLLKVTFYARTGPDKPWISLGTDANAPFNVYIDPLDFPDQTLELRAMATNSKGVVYELPHATVSIPAP
jgi:hypothetical protein